MRLAELSRRWDDATVTGGVEAYQKASDGFHAVGLGGGRAFMQEEDGAAGDLAHDAFHNRIRPPSNGVPAANRPRDVGEIGSRESVFLKHAFDSAGVAIAGGNDAGRGERLEGVSELTL